MKTTYCTFNAISQTPTRRDSQSEIQHAVVDSSVLDSVTQSLRTRVCARMKDMPHARVVNQQIAIQMMNDGRIALVLSVFFEEPDEAGA